MLRFGKGRRAQTILDQAIVSGSNFATGIILVRGLGLGDFGRFTIAYSILLLANSIQLSFISSPMITIGSLSSTAENRTRFLRGMFGAQIMFCATASAAALTAAVLYVGINRTTSTAGVGIILAFVSAIVFYLMQDWLRRYYFTVDKAAASVWNDGISYLGQVIVLCILLWTRTLTIETALWTIAVTSGSAFTLGAVLERLRCHRVEIRDAWSLCRGISIDLGISNQLQWLVYQGAMLVGAGVVGAPAAGAIRATQNAIGPVNMAFQAMENIVPIRAAEEMRRGGPVKVATFLFRFGSIGFAVLLVVFLLTSLFSANFLTLFYGHQLRVYAGVLNLQMLYFLLAWPIRQLTFLFRTVSRTTPILISSIVAAVISLSFVYPMVRTFGALGIMIAAVAGQMGNLIYLIIAWSHLRSAVLESEPKMLAD